MVQVGRWNPYEVSRKASKCLSCGICVEICPYGVHRREGDRVLSDDGECVGGGLCPQGLFLEIPLVRFVKGSTAARRGSEASGVQVHGMLDWFEVPDQDGRGYMRRVSLRQT